MFFICKDRCMCTSPTSQPGQQESSFNIPTVLYCFGEVVIPKATLREDEENEARTSKYSEYFSEYYLQIVQLGVILCLIIFLITILLVIKKDLVAIDRVVKKIVRTCETGEVLVEEEGRGRPGKGDHLEYRECRWDGARNDDISFVSDVS